jgi:hypothetical protein
VRRALLAVVLVACGCDGGAQTLGWEGAATSSPKPLPWFGGPSYYARWPRGLPATNDFFPISVWMQNPNNAARFRAVGVNHYLGLWKGPTEEQLEGLAEASMPAVGEQAGVWQSHIDDAGIVGWLQADGPDNAQENSDGSYSPCIEPSVSQARYAEMVAADPTRPITLLLGQGVATPDWVGRGECTGRTSDYPEYARAADVLVNYTYPLNNGHPLELVATGIDHLNRYAGHEKPVFADLEASSINGDVRPTPEQLRAEAWTAIIAGAAGISWYCHRFAPDFSETDCLDDIPTADALTRINRELSELASVLNTQSFELSPLGAGSVRAVLKQPGRDRYVLAANPTGSATSARFPVEAPGLVEVIDEGRTLSPLGAGFEDDFSPYAVHLYRLR